MKRIIALILASFMMLTLFVSCDKKEEKKLDLTSIIAAKTEHYEIDGSMYAFFLYDFVGQYSSYLQYYGYDITKPISKQTSECTLAEGKTWLEFFADMANSQIDQYLSACEAAYAEGYALTDEQITEVKNYVAQLQADALKNGYKNLDQLLAEYYVEGVTAETFERCLMLQQLSYSYMNDHSLSIEYTNDDLVKFREDHPEKFLMIDVIQYEFYAEYDKDASKEEKEAAAAIAKAKAEDFLAKNKTIESFKSAIVALEQAGGNTTDSPATIISKFLVDAEYYDAEAAAKDAYKPYYEWAYSADRKAGDTFLIEDQYSNGEKYYVVSCIVTPSYFYDYVTKDCRHILFYVNNKETDKDKLALEKADALAKANALLNEFKSGSMTEDDFKALEKKCLDDKSAMEATAYYNVPKGYMVEEFENWIYGERTPGDCEIVETTYGYHVVFFIGNGLPAWQNDAKDGYISEVMTKYQEDIIKTYKVSYDMNEIKKIP